MNMKFESVDTWARGAFLALVLGLAGCGGGGGSGSASASSGGVSAAMKSDAGVQTTSAALQASGIEDDSGLTAQQATSAALDPSSAIPRLNAGDPRNGVYYVYSADGSNGTRQKLGINFDTKSYSLVDSKGSATSGTFSEDPAEPGTYVFANSRITSAVNTARFRITTDAIVGAFPFEKPWSDPVTYQVAPFIAARAFVTDPVQLDGEYNRLGISLNRNGTTDSQILVMSISNGGTQMQLCLDNVIYRSPACPVESRRIFTITPAADFAWTGTNVASPSDVLQFRMARIGGQNVALLGGSSATAPDVRPFRIALRDATTWPTARYVGGSSDGRWGTNLIGPASTTRTSFDSAGGSTTLSLPVNDPGSSGPQGIHPINNGGTDRYFATQNGVLSVVVGARNPGTQGYIQIGLFKDNGGVDPRSGYYQAFSVQRNAVKLTLDFDAGTYQMNEATPNTSSGTFSADPADPSTYIFSSPRIGTVLNTARFRVTDDAIVGAFPFYAGALATPKYQVQPFIAVRNLVTSRADLPGSYDLMVAGMPTAVAPPYFSSGTARLVIGADGNQAQVCKLAPVTTCIDEATPGAFIVSGSSNSWYLFSGGGSMLTPFHIANVGNRKVLLAFDLKRYGGGSDSEIGSYLMLGIRQPATSSSTWLGNSVHSYSGTGELGSLLTSPTSYGGTYRKADGTTGPFALTLGPVTNNERVKIGTDTAGTPYLAINDGRFVFAMPSNGDGSQLHIGLVD